MIVGEMAAFGDGLTCSAQSPVLIPGQVWGGSVALSPPSVLISVPSFMTTPHRLVLGHGKCHRTANTPSSVGLSHISEWHDL